MYLKNIILNKILLTIACSALIFNIEAKFYKEITSVQEYYSICKSNKNNVIMCSTAKCNPCKQMEPNFDKAAQTFKDVNFFKIDLSKKEFNTIMQELNISSVPVLIYFKNGKEYKRDRKGAMTFNEIKDSVEQFLKLTTKSNEAPVKKTKSTKKSTPSKKRSNNKKKCTSNKCKKN